MLPILIAVHVALALTLFVPSILLPFALRARAADHDRRGFTRAFIRLQRDFSLWIGAGLAVSGLALLVVVGQDLISRPWLAVAVGIYISNLMIALVIQRPELRQLLGPRSDTTDAEGQKWRDRARRQRYLSYVMVTGVGLIAFLVTTKPEF